VWSIEGSSKHQERDGERRSPLNITYQEPETILTLSFHCSSDQGKERQANQVILMITGYRNCLSKKVRRCRDSKVLQRLHSSRITVPASSDVIHVQEKRPWRTDWRRESELGSYLT
jgi:hypothetical protein